MSLFASPFDQVVTLDGKPVAGAALSFFVDNLSETPLAVYKDPGFTSPHPAAIKTNAYGQIPAIYVKPEGLTYLARLTLPDGRKREVRGLETGAAVTSSNAASFALPKLPATVKAGAIIQLTAADFGKTIDVPAAHVVPVILPPASSVTDGAIIAIRNTLGGAAAVVQTTSPDLIDDRKGVPVRGAGHALIVVALQSGYEVLARSAPDPTRFIAISRSLITPPASPSPGDTYLAPVNATGGWAPNSIYEADGAGGWIETAARTGLEVVIATEVEIIGAVSQPLVLAWDGTAWVSKGAAAAAAAAAAVSAGTSAAAAALVHRMLYAEETYSQGVAAQSATQNSWTRVAVNTTAHNSLGGTSALAAEVLALDPGTYKLTASHTFVGAGEARLRIKSLDTSKVIYSTPATFPKATTLTDTTSTPNFVLAIPAGSGIVEASGVVALTTQEDFVVEYFVTEVPHAQTLGEPFNNGPEVYGTLLVERIG